ncbi:MAG: FecR domain-containing protein [Opitutales bacterium]|nr:FecR domain-containing protein [Opitutales bacterium]
MKDHIQRNSRKHLRSQKTADSWVVKFDRGLHPDEIKEFDDQCTEDQELVKNFEKSKKAWKISNQIPEDFANEVLASYEGTRARPQFRWREIGIAALLLLGVTGVWIGYKLIPTQENPIQIADVGPSTQRLEDGSIVRINNNSSISVEYSEFLRQVHLLKGEAHFIVEKDPSRPFLVKANGLKVRAVGTAFNVRLEPRKVDVLVTEGTVEIDTIQNHRESIENVESIDSLPEPNLVTTGQRAQISFVKNKQYLSIDVAGAPTEEVEKVLAWQSPLLTLGGGTLEAVAESFQKKTGLNLIVVDKSLNSMRIGGKFPSENVKGFLHILEKNYGIKWHELPNGDLVIGGENE